MTCERALIRAVLVICELVTLRSGFAAGMADECDIALSLFAPFLELMFLDLHSLKDLALHYLVFMLLFSLGSSLLPIDEDALLAERLEMIKDVRQQLLVREALWLLIVGRLLLLE